MPFPLYRPETKTSAQAPMDHLRLRCQNILPK